MDDLWKTPLESMSPFSVVTSDAGMATNSDSRRRGLWFAVYLVLVLCVSARGAGGQPETVVAGTASGEHDRPPIHQVTIEVFIRPDSELCDRAVKLLSTLETGQRGLRVAVRDVVNDLTARERFWKLTRHYQIEKPGLPAFLVLNRFTVGFRDENQVRQTIHELLTLHAFVRDGCPHCRDAKAFLAGLQQRWPALYVALHEVTRDQQALDRMYALAEQHHVAATSLPCLYVCGRFLVGYRDDATTGREIERLLEESQPPRDLTPKPAEVKPKPPAPAPKLDEPMGQRDLRLPRWFDAPPPTRAVAMISKQSHPRQSSLAPSWIGQRFCLSPLPATLVMRAAVTLPGGIVGELSEPPPDAASAPPAADVPQEHSLEQATPVESVPAEAISSDQPADELAVPDEVAIPGEVTGLIEGVPALQTPEGIDLPLFGHLRVSDVGLPAFTFIIGLVDGFNPCAMWVLIFLLSILVNLRDRRKIVAIAGTFVLISGLAYFAFMAAWLNVFVLIGFARPVQIALGLLATFIGAVNVKDFFAFQQGVSLSIPESAKPGIYARVREITRTKYLTAALFGAATLAIFVNVIELLCTAGLPAMYTQILTLHELPVWQNYAYLGLYIVAYMFDDTIMLVIAVATLSHRKLQEREGRWLKLLSGIVILALGIVMIVRPDWLS